MELLRNLGDGPGSGGSGLQSDNFDSVGELYTEDDFRQWLWPLKRRQLRSAASASLNIMARAVLLERHPLARTVRWRTVANQLSHWKHLRTTNVIVR
jgi:hypothetical protein